MTFEAVFKTDAPSENDFLGPGQGKLMEVNNCLYRQYLPQPLAFSARL